MNATRNGMIQKMRPSNACARSRHYTVGFCGFCATLTSAKLPVYVFSQRRLRLFGLAMVMFPDFQTVVLSVSKLFFCTPVISSC